MGKHRYEFQLNKFANTLKSVEEAYRKNPLSHPAHLIYKADGRTPYFQLQGLARIDVGISRHDKVAEQWLDDFKIIEDAFGKYDFWIAAIEQNKKWKFDKKTDNFLRNQALIQLGVLEAKLVDSGWLLRTPAGFSFHKAPLLKFQKEVDNANWYAHKKEKKKLLKFFIKEAMEIQDKLKSGEIDLNMVEEGIHEFRRKLRWLSIYSSALNGKVAIGKLKRGAPLSHYVTAENKSSRFSHLPISEDEKELVEFLPGGFYAMSNLIKNIGDIKDPALYTEEMMRVVARQGLSLKEGKKALGATFMGHKDAVKQAKSVIERMVFKENLLYHIADYFDQQS